MTTSPSLASSSSLVSVLVPRAELPASLERLGESCPPGLRLRGALPSFERAVAIVGTRDGTATARGFARTLAAQLAEQGVVVVSGGAAGIDRAAHEGALLVGGVTVVVHASGLARPYPADHASLFERIARTGAELSEYDDDARPRRHQFLARNRLVAALVGAVVVVEAPLRSGALSTVAWARKLGVPLCVVPWGPGREESAGSNALLREPDVRVCLDASDVLAALGSELPSEARVPRRSPSTRATRSAPSPTAVLVPEAELGASARALLRAIGDGHGDVDALVEALGWELAAVHEALVELELAGLVVTSPRGRLERA